MQSNHLILCRPLLLPPSIFPSIRVFSNESVPRIRRPKYWSFSFSPSNEYSGLISFRMDWLDLLAVQGTLKSLLQYHSSEASIFWRSAFFIVHLSHPYTLWQVVIISLFSVKKSINSPHATTYLPILLLVDKHASPLHPTTHPLLSSPQCLEDPGPPSPASDDTIPTHPQCPSSPNPTLLLSAPAGISSQKPALCGCSSLTAHSLFSPRDTGGALMAGGSGRRGGSVRVSYLWGGGVSVFHHCFFSCCVMLGKLPDISELWLPRPYKRGLNSCYLTHSLQEPTRDKCLRRRGISVSICFSSSPLPGQMSVLHWESCSSTLLPANSPPPSSEVELLG